MRMKKLLIMVVLLATAMSTMAQNQLKADELTSKEIRRWVKSGAWRNGFQDAKPDKTVDVAEFYRQYQKNPEQWMALFQWLSTTDLLSIPKGKHPIAGTSLVASVEESQNEPLENRRSESHRRKIDFQYVVKGTEGFATLDHASSRPNCKYDQKKDVIHYDYDVSKTHFFNSRKGTFVIFFPDDWHIAKIATKKNDQQIRVIVIKVDYVE